MYGLNNPCIGFILRKTRKLPNVHAFNAVQEREALGACTEPHRPKLAFLALQYIFAVAAYWGRVDRRSVDTFGREQTVRSHAGHLLKSWSRLDDAESPDAAPQTFPASKLPVASPYP